MPKIEPTDVDLDIEDWSGLLSSPAHARVEQRVIRQLVEGLVFEDAIRVAESRTPGDAEIIKFSLNGRDATGAPISYIARGKLKASFGRIRLLASPLQRVTADAKHSDATLMGFLMEVIAGYVPIERMQALIDELQQTLLKDLQSQVHSGVPETADPDWDHDLWEGHLQEGHPYHPSYKSRIGFTLNDNARYGPEFRRAIRPVWIAIAKDMALVSVSSAYPPEDFLQQQLGLPAWQRFQKKLAKQTTDPAAYTLLPVHPWQWSNRILAHFHPELVAGTLIHLGPGDDDYRAQQSIRTLSNACDPDKANLKLALSITNTSTSRGLAAHTVQNSAMISDWLHGLVARDESAAAFGLVILRELLGIAYRHDQLPTPRQAPTYATLGAIWRESLHPYLKAGERAIAFNGLTQCCASGAPMMDGWVRDRNVKSWTQQLLDVSVAPIVHLLYAHGIGLEAHGQNILLIHRHGWPERIALKDFHDGVRFSPELLSEPANGPALIAEPAHHAAVNRNSFIITKSPEHIRDYTFDAFVFIALTELCLSLEQHYGLSEADFWAMTADTITRYQAAHPHLSARFTLFDLFAERVNIENLTKRRLFGDDELHFTMRDNPLHRYAPSRPAPAC